MYFLICIVTLLICHAAPVYPDTIKALWPMDQKAMNAFDQPQTSDDFSTSQFKEQGFVQLATDIFRPLKKTNLGTKPSATPSFQEKVLSFQFNPDHTFSIHIDSDNRPNPGTLCLQGHLQGMDVSTFTMTLTEQSFLITLQHIQDSILYRVTGDTDTGLGKVQQIDLGSDPPRYYSPPVIP